VPLLLFFGAFALVGGLVVLSRQAAAKRETDILAAAFARPSVTAKPLPIRPVAPPPTVVATPPSLKQPLGIPTPEEFEAQCQAGLDEASFIGISVGDLPFADEACKAAAYFPKIQGQIHGEVDTKGAFYLCSQAGYSLDSTRVATGSTLSFAMTKVINRSDGNAAGRYGDRRSAASWYEEAIALNNWLDAHPGLCADAIRKGITS
jgi:hypothetical protein